MSGRALMSMALALFVGLLVCSLFTEPASAEANVPDGFSDETVVAVPAPTALAFTPDGRMLVASRSGELRVYENGALVPDPALELAKICTNKERGLLGLAVDPNFGSPGNNYVYLYYTYKKHGVCPQDRPESNKNPVNRVVRFTLSDDDTATFDKILLNNILSPNGNHNGGDLHFGKDGNLYASVGDGGCNLRRPNLCQYDNAASRYRNIPLSKILRITPDGGIPADNPFRGEASGRCNVEGRTARGKTCQEAFALGFRNPFRFAIDPDEPTTRLYVNDVGGKKREEIDDVESGKDYGWNLCEGSLDNRDRRGKVNCDGASYTGPIHEYSHTTGCRSITGGAFVPNDANWPGVSDDAYLFGDFICGKVFELTPDGAGGFTREQFASGLGPGPISMTFGPNGTGEALYYTTFENRGQVRRIAPVAGG